MSITLFETMGLCFGTHVKANGNVKTMIYGHSANPMKLTGI